MKMAELKVRDEISEYILSKVECDWEWKGHLGEIWIETKRIAENTIINCYYSSIQFMKKITNQENYPHIIQFKFAPIRLGLTQLRRFLEQIKRDKECYRYNFRL